MVCARMSDSSDARVLILAEISEEIQGEKGKKYEEDENVDKFHTVFERLRKDRLVILRSSVIGR